VACVRRVYYVPLHAFHKIKKNFLLISHVRSVDIVHSVLTIKTEFIAADAFVELYVRIIYRNVNVFNSRFEAFRVPKPFYRLNFTIGSFCSQRPPFKRYIFHARFVYLLF